MKKPLNYEFEDLKSKTILKQQPSEEHLNVGFPSSVISGVAGDFAKVYGSHLEAPEHFFFMSYLTVFGLYVSDKLCLKSQRKLAPRFFVVFLGESDNAKKSTAIEEATEHFSDLLKSSGDNSFKVCRGAASGEGLGRLLKKTPKVLVFYDELKTFASKAGIKNSTLLPCINTLFESVRFENWTSRDPLMIEHGLIAMLAASTVDTYSNLFSPAFMDIGFNNRLFLVPGDSDKDFCLPSPIPESEIKRLHNQLQKRLNLLQGNLTMSIEKDALKYWDQFYKYIKRQGPHAKRLDQYGLRLMPIIALNDMKTTVDFETVEKVISLLKWQLNVRQIYDPIDAEGKIARMEESIRRAFKIDKKWTRRDLQRKTHYNRHGIWVWESAIKNLIGNSELWLDAKTGIYNSEMSRKPKIQKQSNSGNIKALTDADLKKLNE